MNIFTRAITALFSTSKAGDAAVDIVRKISGTDGMTEKEKAAFIIKYLETTQHQSLPRRIVALVITALYAIIVISWVIAVWLSFDEAAEKFKDFLLEVLNNPFTLILTFYFTINIVRGLKK